MDEFEQLAEQIQKRSDSERLLLYLATERALERTQMIGGLYREIGILEGQVDRYNGLFWRGLGLSVPPISLAVYFNMAYLTNVLSIGATVGLIAVVALIHQTKNRVQLVKERLRRSEMRPHYSYHPDEDEDLKTDLELWRHVSNWWAVRTP